MKLFCHLFKMHPKVKSNRIGCDAKITASWAVSILGVSMMSLVSFSAALVS